MSDVIRATVLGIYDTVADPSLWPDRLQRVAEQIDAVGCIIFEWSGTLEGRRLLAPISSSYYDPASVQTYIDRHFREEAIDQDVFEYHSMKSDSIDLIEDEVLAPSDDDLKKRSNVVTLQKLGILHRAAGLLNKDNTASSRFSIQFGVGRGRMDEEERHHLGSILPHIAKALDLGKASHQLARAYGSVLNAMDRLNIGICVLDSDGRVVHENDEFRRQREYFSVYRKSPDGKLRFSSADDHKQFETLKADAFNHGKFGARPRKEAISTESEGFLCIEIAPLNKSEEIGSKVFGGFILQSTDTSKSMSCSAQPIMQTHGLTEAEMAVLELLATGMTNVQVAETRDRSTATINAQVKSILLKTDCSTRTQLVRMMMSFGANYLV